MHMPLSSMIRNYIRFKLIHFIFAFGFALGLTHAKKADDFKFSGNPVSSKKVVVDLEFIDSCSAFLNEYVVDDLDTVIIKAYRFHNKQLAMINFFSLEQDLRDSLYLYDDYIFFFSSQTKRFFKKEVQAFVKLYNWDQSPKALELLPLKHRTGEVLFYREHYRGCLSCPLIIQMGYDKEQKYFIGISSGPVSDKEWYNIQKEFDPIEKRKDYWLVNNIGEALVIFRKKNHAFFVQSDVSLSFLKSVAENLINFIEL